ncbi:DUF2924 domain-containing protein [Candidatus Proelusimicrobium volucris]|uniref:DUF2924 domain-containing protein n=1 Tax=Candidatus Proelusimicrobium volucris TaxID=3416225 RepID=UPI003D129A39
MTDYTHCTVQQLRAKWTEVINRPIPPIRRSIIIKYLIWYEQAKREKISFLGFFNEVKQASVSVNKHTVILEAGSKITRSYKGVVHTVEVISNGYLYNDKQYKSLSGIAKTITGKSWNGKVFFGVKDEK